MKLIYSPEDPHRLHIISLNSIMRYHQEIVHLPYNNKINNKINNKTNNKTNNKIKILL